MPILDPSIQKFFSNPPKQLKSSTCFLRRYLRIASRYQFQNSKTFETLILFEKDIKESIPSLSNIFGFQQDKNIFDFSSNNNCYKYIYNILKSTQENPKSLDGDYYLINSKYYDTKIFQPYLFIQDNHSWFFTDTPIAILGINFEQITERDVNVIYNLIKLEIDLMSAAGFTLILCTNYNIQNRDFLFDIIQRNQFSEIHFNITNSIDLENFLRNTKKVELSYIKPFTGYFYLYTPYVRKESDCREFFKELKSRPRFSIVSFAENGEKALNSVKMISIEPFIYCQTGFKYNNLRIRLSNVPIYDCDCDSISFVPSQTSDVSTCYISPNDFLNWQNKRVKVLFENDIKNDLVEKYVNFEDIHKIRKDLFVKDTLLLTKIEDETKTQIDKIEKNINEIIKQRKNKKFKKSSIFSFSKNKLIENGIEYVTYAYTYTSHSLENEFSIHRPQIYTLLEASKTFLKSNIKLNNMIENELSLSGFLSLDTDELLEILPEDEKKIINYLKQNQERILELSDSEINELSESLFEDQDYLIKYIKNEGNNFINKILDDKKKFYDSKFLQAKDNIQKNFVKRKFDQGKGVIYQVETGEGKSCIVCIIAAILALNGKTVHITSSNINLSNRDYMNSFDFFKLLKLKSAVLLHDNELPIAPKKKKEETEKSKNDNISISDKQSNEYENSNDNNKNENDTFFKDNMDKYFNTFTQDDKTEYPKYYYDKELDYYTEDQFHNSSRMNFSVCGLDCNNEKPKNRPNIIFSTFVNFECFYLKMMELSPGYIDEYFSNCALLIDEADSILIDEISNGTIVSREMKSNSKEILKFVYNQKKLNIDAEETFTRVKKKWPKCVDLTLNDINKMYSEIELVNREEFRNGRKYSIETFEVKNNSKKEKLFKESLNLLKSIGEKVVNGLVKEFTSDNKEFEEEDDDEDEDDEEEEKNDDNDPVTVFRHIVPFDYDHKGILEPNKEFSGFIQQFIAIKESENEENTNMIIKDLSMSYLYVSHPIFVNLYSQVFGFTGTIGNEKEKKIYKDRYGLETLRIPRNEANQRVEFPTILCENIEERNQKIIFEVLHFHKKGNPVLVIFQDLKEIDNVASLLYLNGIKNINIFNGKNEIIKPDLIAGIPKAVSLGTNVCGRGTNIITQDKPLHVIISYYTSNTRVMNQAHGRTARQGKKGTSRIICVKEQFLYPTTFLFDENGIDSAIEEFSIKNQLQTEYISYFKDTKPWIFSNEMTKQKIDDNDIKLLRSARINVNRIVAYNFEFPLKMSINTFLKIQEQKIFSILNCPNSKFTWRLFQKYIREMILESWSLMINNVDETFFEKTENIEYKKELDKLHNLNLSVQSLKYQNERKKLNSKFVKNIEKYKEELNKGKEDLLIKLQKYLPSNKTNIVSTFMFIFNKVLSEYQDDVLNSFNKISGAYLQYNKIGFMSCQIGFKPYSLLTKSGARINYKNYKKTNFIKDPELKYLKRTPKRHICLLSITEKIDDIFNLIFQKINELLGKKTFLKLFMRRTLCGCEFGICLNFLCKNDRLKDPNCIIDKDPLLLFTISVRSMIPILAGILIILLVYLASMSKKIGEWFVNFPKMFTKEVVLRGVGVIVNIVAPELINFALDKVIKFLRKTLNKQLEVLETASSENAQLAAIIIKNLLKIFSSSVGDKINEKVSSFLGDKIHVTLNWHTMVKNSFDIERIMKISFLLLLCLATFIMNFNTRKDAIEKEKKDAKEYEKALKNKSIMKKELEINEEKATKAIDDLCQKEKVEGENKAYHVKDVTGDTDDEDEDVIIKLSAKQKEERNEEILHKIEKSSEMIMKTYFYKFTAFNPLEKLIKLSKFVKDTEPFLDDVSNAIAEIKYFTQKKGSKKCIRLRYHGFQAAFIQQVRIYETNKFPSILGIFGYKISGNDQDLFVESKEKGSLMNVVSKNSLDNTNKFIIAYGIAQGMKFLHMNNIVHRNLNPSIIMIDSNFYPYISEFYYAKQTETPLQYCLKKIDPEFMAPEFIKDYKSNQNSFKLDIYSYGMTLYYLVTGIYPFENMSEKEIIQNAISENPKMPEFPNDLKIDSDWINLIQNCWNKTPSQRPSFNKIVENLEMHFSTSSITSIDSKKFESYKKLFTKSEK